MKIKDQYSIIGKYIIDELDPRDNYLFREVARLCLEQRKDVWVVDPAYNESFIAFRSLLHAPFIGGLLAVSGAMIYDFLEQHQHDRFTRKELLRGALSGTIALASTITATGLGIGAVIGPSRVPGLSPVLGKQEDEFRDNLVPENLIRLGNRLPAQTDALFIYPPWHLRNIIYSLDHEDHRVQILRRYGWMERIPIFQPLFQIRHYPGGEVNQGSKYDLFKKYLQPA